MKEKPYFKETSDLQKTFFEELSGRYKTFDKIFQAYGIRDFRENVLPLIKNIFQSEIENIYKGLEGLDEITSPETKQEMEIALREKIEQLLKKIDRMIEFLKVNLKNQIEIIKEIYNFVRQKIEEELNILIAKQNYPRLTKEELEMLRFYLLVDKILKALIASASFEGAKDYKDILEIFKKYFQNVIEKKEIVTNLQGTIWFILFLLILKIKFNIDPKGLI